jgi:hypothetical protein
MTPDGQIQKQGIHMVTVLIDSAITKEGRGFYK